MKMCYFQQMKTLDPNIEVSLYYKLLPKDSIKINLTLYNPNVSINN